jgi:hypothetical protein
MSSSVDDGNGLGRMVKAGYIKLADGNSIQRRLSCPSSHFDDSNGLNKTMYILNPHLCARTIPGGVGAQQWFKKLSKMAKFKGGPTVCYGSPTPVDLMTYRKVLMSDPVYSYPTMSHPSGANRSFNLLYPDGSVTTVIAKPSMIRTYPDLTTGNNGSWNSLLDQVNFLSHLADGGGKYGASGKPLWNDLYNALPMDPL